MPVRVEHVRDPHPAVASLVQVRGDVPTRVDHERLAGPLVAHEVRGVPETLEMELPEMHDPTLPKDRGTRRSALARGAAVSVCRMSVGAGRVRRVSDTIIRTEGLRKTFGEVEALKGVDLLVERGTVFGLLGPNGAGKTTSVRILSTLLHPDEGVATVDGLDVVRDAEVLRSRIGLAGQFAAVDENLTGFENLEMVGRLYHLPRAEARRRAGEVLERFRLSDAADRAAKTYSGGMRRRLDVGASLVGRPNVLFLDEPTTGLDPRSRMDLWALIRELQQEGMTLLLCTQYLEEADHLSDRIAVIDVGTVIAEGTSDELKDKVGGQVLEVAVQDGTSVRDVAASLGGIGSGEPMVDDEARRIRIQVGSDGHTALMETVRRLADARIELSDIGLHRPTLDDVFLSLTGHTAEDGMGAEEDEVVTKGRGKRRGEKAKENA